MKPGYFKTSEYQKTIDDFNERWSTDSEVWDKSWAFGLQTTFETPKQITAEIKKYSTIPWEPASPRIPSTDFMLSAVTRDPTYLELINNPPIETCSKILVPDSFIHMITKNKISILDVEHVGIDGPGEEPFGHLSEFTGVDPNDADHWYFYTFDWRSYQNLNPTEKYDPSIPLVEYYSKMTEASLPLAIKLLGRKLESTDIKKFRANYVDFGGFTRDHRGTDFDPGLTFLIGISKTGVVSNPGENTDASTDLNVSPSEVIMVQVNALDDFDKIADILKRYNKVRGKVPPVKITPSVDFDEEAKLIKDFKEAVKTLLKDTATATTTQKSFMHSKELWNQPGNLLQINISAKPNQSRLDILSITEYTPGWNPASKKRAFLKGVDCPGGATAVRRLGKIDKHRTIDNGGLLAKEFAAFKKSSGVRDPRTTNFISKMHGRNSSNEGLNPKFDRDPHTGGLKLNFYQFIDENDGFLGPMSHKVEYLPADAVMHPDKVARILADKSPMASARDRTMAEEMTNNPGWAKEWTEKYVEGSFGLQNATDQFWQTLPQKRDRLRLSESAPYDLDNIFLQVLNQSDVKTLVATAIKCWLDPQGWLEIACRYAMKELGGDAFFERIAKDGTLDKLKATAEIAKEIGAAASTIETQKKMQQSEYQLLHAEAGKYDTQVEELSLKKAEVQNKIDSTKSTNKSRLKTLNKEKEEIDMAIKGAMGRRRQVEMDGMYANANASAGTYMPSSYGGVSNAKVAGAANDISKSIMKISDPNFKKDLCKNIISYSANAVELLVSLSKSLADLVSEDEKKKKEEKKPEHGEEKDRPRKKTTKFGTYFEEAARAIGAQIAKGIMLFFIKRLLNEVITACQNLKNALWDDLNRRKPGKRSNLPGTANFDDLLKTTPSAAARDLVKKLGAQVDVTDPEIVTNIGNLMEDLELLLTQVELCVLLNKGQATSSVLKIVKNLIMTKYADLYLSLKGSDKTLSSEKIIKFFMNFQGYVDSKFCEEIQKKLPVQLYNECDIPPYVHSLCEDLLEGKATKKQIENVCKRAKLDRMDKILDLVDKAYSPEPILPPDDCDNPNALPHDMFPTNLINDTLMDQNLRTLNPTFKSEMFYFKNKLFTGYLSGFPPLAADAKFGDDVQDNMNALKEIAHLPQGPWPILPTIQESLNAPFYWIPGGGELSVSPTSGKQSELLSSFMLVSPPITTVAGTSTDIIEYYFSINDDWSDQIIETKYYEGINKLGPFNFAIKNGAVIPGVTSVEDQIKKYLQFNMPNAATIQLGKMNISSPYLFQYQIPAGAVKEDGWYHSPLEQEFFTVLEKNFPQEVYDHLTSELIGTPVHDQSMLDLKNMFNIVTRDLGVHLSRTILKSSIFNQLSHDKLLKFFNSFFPKEVFPADEACDIKDVSFLKVEEMKQRIRARNKDLHCEGPPPDIDNETPNLSRAIAEGTVYTLARLYTFETFLRLLPLSTTFKIKDVLESEVIINLIVYTMMHELAMLDYRNTHKTTSGDIEEKTAELAPEGPPPIKYITTPSGKNVYIEEPPIKTTGTKAGNLFEPKFQAHVIYYANKILETKIKEATKQGAVLLDPLTDQVYEYDGDPYSLSGMKYLLKEQITSVSNFMEKEFENILEIEVQDWKHAFLSSFLYQDLLKAPGIENIFDLMPSATSPWTSWHPSGQDVTYTTKPRLYEKLMNRYRAITQLDYTPPIMFNLGHTGPTQLIVDFDATEGEAAHAGFWSFLQGQESAGDIMHAGEDIVISRLANRSNIGPNGGFILEPYIRVKQHKKIESFDFDFSNLPDSVKQQYAEKVYHEFFTTYLYSQPHFEKWIEDNNLIGTEACPEPGGSNTPVWFDETCQKSWKAHVMEGAMAAKKKALESDAGNLAEIDPWALHDLPDLWGDPFSSNGVYININDWTEFMTTGNFGIAKYQGITQAEEPHTNYFDPWMYGLRLVYVLPLEYTYAPLSDDPGASGMYESYLYSIGDTVQPGQMAGSFPWEKGDDFSKLALEDETDFLAFQKVSPDRETAFDKRNLSSDEPFLNGMESTKVIHFDDLHTFFGVDYAYQEADGTHFWSFNSPLLVDQLPPAVSKIMKNKKSYILHEKILRKDLGMVTGWEDKMFGAGDYDEDPLWYGTANYIASPPIVEIPLIEVEIPVGELDLTEQGELYNYHYNKAKEEGKTDNEASQAAKSAVDQVQTPVPLGYFSYQDSLYDEFPLNKLLDSMTKTSEFENIFENIFPYKNYKTLISLYILIQTFELDEYVDLSQYDVPAGGDTVYKTVKEIKAGMFNRTKEELRTIFYSNTQAADPMRGGAPSASASQANQTKDTGEDSDWQKFLDELLGSPPSYASLMAMTPMAVLKAYVSIVDPKWKKCNPLLGGPFTPAGIVQCALGALMPGPWFGNIFPKGDYDQNALECPKPTDPTQKTTVEDYTANEMAFAMMMKDYGIIEDDYNWILRQVYPATDDKKLLIVGMSETKEHKRFSSTALFNILLAVRNIEPNADLGVIFSTLREYYDTYIEAATHYREYVHQYKELISTTSQSEVYFTNNAWVLGSGAVNLLLFDCNEKSILDAWANNQKEICTASNKFKLARKQILALESIYNGLLSALNIEGLGVLSYGTNLPSVMAMMWADNTPIFSNVKTPSGEAVSIFEEGKTIEEIKAAAAKAAAEADPLQFVANYTDNSWSVRSVTGKEMFRYYLNYLYTLDPSNMSPFKIKSGQATADGGIKPYSEFWMAEQAIFHCTDGDFDYQWPDYKGFKCFEWKSPEEFEKSTDYCKPTGFVDGTLVEGQVQGCAKSSFGWDRHSLHGLTFSFAAIPMPGHEPLFYHAMCDTTAPWWSATSVAAGGTGPADWKRIGVGGNMFPGDPLSTDPKAAFGSDPPHWNSEAYPQISPYQTITSLQQQIAIFQFRLQYSLMGSLKKWLDSMKYQHPELNWGDDTGPAWISFAPGPTGADQNFVCSELSDPWEYGDEHEQTHESYITYQGGVFPDCRDAYVGLEIYLGQGATMTKPQGTLFIPQWPGHYWPQTPFIAEPIV